MQPAITTKMPLTTTGLAHTRDEFRNCDGECYNDFNNDGICDKRCFRMHGCFIEPTWWLQRLQLQRCTVDDGSCEYVAAVPCFEYNEETGGYDPVMIVADATATSSQSSMPMATECRRL